MILRALSGRQRWLRVADVLGVSPRTVPVAEGQRLLRLSRERYGPRDEHLGVNVRHFCQTARRAHGTLQGRLVNELRGTGNTTVAAANRSLDRRFRPDCNTTFGRPPAGRPAP